MRLLLPGILAVWCAACGLLAGEARAAVPSNSACLTCHANGISRVAPGRRGSIQVDPSKLAASVHARLSCSHCHTDASSIPHAERLAPVRCATCHGAADAELKSGGHAAVGTRERRPEGPARDRDRETACRTCHGSHDVRPAADIAPALCRTCHAKVVEQYQASVHGVFRAGGDEEVSTCRDCHGSTHAALTHRDPGAPTSRARLAETCAACHADRELSIRSKIPIPAAVALYRNSVHGRSEDPHAATCTDCHESHRLLRANDPASSVFRANIPATCGHCHARETRDYEQSIHGVAAARGVRASPVCTDCHGEHLVRGPHDPDSRVAPSAVTATCSHCHESIGIRETYGLPAGRLSTYQDSFHGLAARGGSPVAANCASCHGYHRILPSSDPASDIHPANLPATCGQCHPGAGERFAHGAVHVVMARPDRPILHIVRLIYLWLIVLTIGGMALHNILDFFRKLQRRLREHLGAAVEHAVTGGRWLVRMTLSERVQHGLLAVSFFVLVYTGFALKFPESWLFAWLARLEHGYEWRSLIHRVAAIVMLAAAAFHLVYLFTKRGRGVLAALAPHPADAIQLGQNLLYLCGLRRSPPAFERFSYIEKAEYWALVWGTVIMTVTGFALWFENWSLQWVDKWVLDLATLIHYYEAWLAFLAILIWHMYQTVLNPDVYPMNWTWLTGRITEEQLRHEHEAEWRRLVVEEPARPEGEPEESRGDTGRAAEKASRRGDSFPVRGESPQKGRHTHQRGDQKTPDPGEAPGRSP